MSIDQRSDRIDALDGVRAVAVALVLLFHAGWSWMPAGYLGVSVFFTLSGFLITRLLLAEHASTQRIDLASFAARRLRRLLPASVLCLAAVVIARGAGAFAAVPALRRDIIGALTQSFNWVRLAGSSSYADLFAGASASTVSPVEHFWSLAIEEQFYLIWPLVAFGLVRYAGGNRRRVAWWIAGITLAFAVGAPLIATGMGPDAAYWSTPARLAEILVGATLAAAMHAGVTVPRRASLLAPPALATIVVASMLWPSGGGPAYGGWLPVFSLASAALITGVLVPGPVQRLLSRRPLVWLGGISYGLYLFHWPVYTVLRERGLVLDRPGPFALALVLTVGFAVASSRLVELPIRRTHAAPARTALIAFATIVAVFAAASVVPAVRGDQRVDRRILEDAALRPTASVPELGVIRATAGDASASVDAGQPVVQQHPTPLVSRPVRILVVGDSTAESLGEGLASWAVAHPATASVSLVTSQGFGLLLDGTVTSWNGDPFVQRSMVMLADDIPAAVRSLQPDVVVLMTTINDITDRRWSDEEGVISPLDQRFADRLNAAYREGGAAISALSDARLVWVVPPAPTTEWESVGMRDPARYAVQHTVIRNVAAAAGAPLVDLEGWMTRTGVIGDAGWRPDGTHLSSTAATTTAEDYLGPLLVDLALQGA